GAMGWPVMAQRPADSLDQGHVFPSAESPYSLFFAVFCGDSSSLCAFASLREIFKALTRSRVLPSDRACSLVRPLARDSAPLLWRRFLQRAPNLRSKAA